MVGGRLSYMCHIQPTAVFRGRVLGEQVSHSKWSVGGIFYLKANAGSGLDYLVCAIFSRQR